MRTATILIAFILPFQVDFTKYIVPNIIIWYWKAVKRIKLIDTNVERNK